MLTVFLVFLVVTLAVSDFVTSRLIYWQRRNIEQLKRQLDQSQSGRIGS